VVKTEKKKKEKSLKPARLARPQSGGKYFMPKQGGKKRPTPEGETRGIDLSASILLARKVKRDTITADQRVEGKGKRERGKSPLPSALPLEKEKGLRLPESRGKERKRRRLEEKKEKDLWGGKRFLQASLKNEQLKQTPNRCPHPGEKRGGKGSLLRLLAEGKRIFFGRRRKKGVTPSHPLGFRSFLLKFGSIILRPD